MAGGTNNTQARDSNMADSSSRRASGGGRVGGSGSGSGSSSEGSSGKLKKSLLPANRVRDLAPALLEFVSGHAADMTLTSPSVTRVFWRWLRRLHAGVLGPVAADNSPTGRLPKLIEAGPPEWDSNGTAGLLALFVSPDTLSSYVDSVRASHGLSGSEEYGLWMTLCRLHVFLSHMLDSPAAAAWGALTVASCASGPAPTPPLQGPLPALKARLTDLQGVYYRYAIESAARSREKAKVLEPEPEPADSVSSLSTAHLTSSAQAPLEVSGRGQEHTVGGKDGSAARGGRSASGKAGKASSDSSSGHSGGSSSSSRKGSDKGSGKGQKGGKGKDKGKGKSRGLGSEELIAEAKEKCVYMLALLARTIPMYEAIVGEIGSVLEPMGKLVSEITLEDLQALPACFVKGRYTFRVLTGVMVLAAMVHGRVATPVTGLLSNLTATAVRRAIADIEASPPGPETPIGTITLATEPTLQLYAAPRHVLDMLLWYYQYVRPLARISKRVGGGSDQSPEAVAAVAAIRAATADHIFPLVDIGGLEKFREGRVARDCVTDAVRTAQKAVLPGVFDRAITFQWWARTIDGLLDAVLDYSPVLRPSVGKPMVLNLTEEDLRAGIVSDFHALQRMYEALMGGEGEVVLASMAKRAELPPEGAQAALQPMSTARPGGMGPLASSHVLNNAYLDKVTKLLTVDHLDPRNKRSKANSRQLWSPENDSVLLSALSELGVVPGVSTGVVVHWADLAKSLAGVLKPKRTASALKARFNILDTHALKKMGAGPKASTKSTKSTKSAKSTKSTKSAKSAKSTKSRSKGRSKGSSKRAAAGAPVVGAPVPAFAAPAPVPMTFDPVLVSNLGGTESAAAALKRKRPSAGGDDPTDGLKRAKPLTHPAWRQEPPVLAVAPVVASEPVAVAGAPASGQRHTRAMYTSAQPRHPRVEPNAIASTMRVSSAFRMPDSDDDDDDDDEDEEIDVVG